MAMPFIPFKLKTANAPSRFAHFDGQPSWADLSSKITQLYNIPSDRVAVAFIAQGTEPAILSNEQDLQWFYKSLYQSSEEIKFVVQDLQSPDSKSTITSTWSMDSNLSQGGMQSAEVRPVNHLIFDLDDKLKLWCWIVNKSDSPFSVEIGLSKAVDDLKKAIKKQKKPELDHLAADSLHIWKLSLPIPSAEVDVKLRPAQTLNEIPGCVKLNPLDDLSKHFSSPSRQHIHIIVQIPSILGNEAQINKRNITPTESTLGIDVIDPLIKQELESLRVVIETFLKSPEPPTWVPPEYATPSNREFLASLRIPSYRNGNPSLLFHDLHVCDGDEINKIFGDARHLCICNTSGSGKTRRMLEGLTKYWGFYLVAIPDVNGVGIRDLQDVLNKVTEYREWVSNLSPLSSEKRVAQSDINTQIASKLLKKVLAARIVVFELFLELVIQIDGELQEKHKRIWLLFQLFGQLDPRVGAPHPFLRIMRRCLRHASADALDILIERLDAIRGRYLPPSLFIVGLDEAQQAVRSYRYSFISSTSNDLLRSILREIVKVFTQPSIKLVVSGTGLSLEDIKEAMASGVSKPDESVILFHELGMFDTWPKLQAFLKRYIPVSFLETPSGYLLQQRIREYLLGRYRFSVSFLEYFLRNGLQSPHKLLNEYIKSHTTCLPGDSDLVLNEPELHITVGVIGFEWNRLQNDPPALQEAAEIVQSHLTRGRSPTFGPVTARLVEYGIAHLREQHKGQIVEPLAFLSLMKWLEHHGTANMQRNIRLRLANQSSRGEAYEQLVVMYLLRALCYPVPFSTIFQFHGTPPQWADEMAQIFGRLDGTAVPVDVLGKAPQNPCLGVVHSADGIEDVLEWIENRTTAPAVLVPDNLFGPDVMIWCGDVLLMGQLKSYTEGNQESLDAKTISYALTSLHPAHWYKQSPPHLRQKLIDAIERHHVLRFVGGYPLPPNLSLRANSVRDALTVLGPDVVLATINLDTFRAHFVTEDQARDVLGPMEHALSRKRKADEMDSGN